MLLAGVASADDAVPKANDLFQTLDANGDGKLVASEIGEAQQNAFKRLLRVGDADGNGELTKDEYLNGLKSTKPGTTDPQKADAGPPRGQKPGMDVDRLFERIDRDGDGKVALADLPERLQERLKPLFERLGKDELTKEDFATFRRLQGGRPGDGMRPPGDRPQMALIKLLDTDGNGMLSREELAKLADRFSELDHNSDGLLDGPELLGFGGPPPRDGVRPPERPDGAPPTGDPKKAQKKKPADAE